MKKENTLLELLMGIVLSGAVVQIVLVIALKDYLYNAIGLWCGVAVACFWAIHLKRSIEDSLDLGVEGGERHARNAYMVRMLITAVVLGVVIYFRPGNPVTLVIGVLSLKIAAYLQPYTHKLFLRFQNRKDEKNEEKEVE